MSANHATAVSEAIDLVRAAAAAKTPLRICGGGSKAFFQAHETGTRLATGGMNGVMSYEPSELVITVAAGTPLADIETLLAGQRQCLPFEPPHFAWAGAAARATIGGMVAAGLAGPARANAGGVRDYVLGLKLLNGIGEHLTFGGQVMKNVAGYDVSRLMVGAMGSLGLITEVSLKVLPIAHAEATLSVRLTQHDALEQLHRWCAEPLPFNASVWGDGVLHIRLRGAVAAVESAVARIRNSHGADVMDAAQAANWWSGCRNQTNDFFTQADRETLALWRISVPQTAPVLDLAWPQFVEWHGGQRWVWAPMQAGSTLQAMARSAGGSATVFVAAYADSAGEKPMFGMKPRVDTVTADVTRNLKLNFDPFEIFNPGLSLYANHPRA